jgi:hypothetical protein
MRSTSPVGRTDRSRRLLWIGGVVAVVVVGLVVLGLALRGVDDARTPSAAAGTTAPLTAEGPPAAAPAVPTPEPTGPTDDVDEPPPSRPAVALDETAEAGDGVTASITSVEAIDGTATGPGNVAGPALRVTVRVDNGTDGPVSLGGVSVDLTYGEDLVPASPLGDPSAAPFTGTIAPGEGAEGVYVFSIPVEDRGSVTLSVGYQAGAPIMVFTGPVG